jgi:MoxR-like ATPase
MDNQNAGVYTGAYVTEIADVLRASALSGVNAMLVSPPGYGKTEMVVKTAEKVCDKGGVVVKYMHYATLPEELLGLEDPKKALNEGVFERNLVGSVYDPHAKIVILDELWMTNDTAFSILMHAMERKAVNGGLPPVFWGTGNALPSGKRLEALRDRIGLAAHIEVRVGSVNPAEVVRNQMRNGGQLDMPGVFPTWEQVTEIRRAEWTQRAIDAVAEVINSIVDEMIEASIPALNPRKWTQWQKILSTVSMWESGTPDFDKVSETGMAVLRHCFDGDDSCRQKFSEIIDSLANVFKSALESIKERTYEEFKRLRNAYSDDSQRTTLAQRLGEVLAQAEIDLAVFRGDHPDEVRKATDDIMALFQKVVAGGEM